MVKFFSVCPGNWAVLSICVELLTMCVWAVRILKGLCTVHVSV